MNPDAEDKAGRHCGLLSEHPIAPVKNIYSLSKKTNKMKKKTLLAMSIAMCCVMNYSCTSDFEDEAVQPAAKRAVVQAWSPEVLQRARELGIIIVDEDRQWNNLTEDDVTFYLNLLAEKGDSAFTPAVVPQLNATGMLRRMSPNTVEETGSTVHDHTCFISRGGIDGNVKYRMGISVTWSVVDGVATNILGNGNVCCINTNCARSYFSGSLSLTPSGENVNYSLDGTLTAELYKSNSQNGSKGGKISEYDDIETKVVWIHERGTAVSQMK